MLEVIKGDGIGSFDGYQQLPNLDIEIENRHNDYIKAGKKVAKTYGTEIFTGIAALSPAIPAISAAVPFVGPAIAIASIASSIVSLFGSSESIPDPPPKLPNAWDWEGAKPADWIVVKEALRNLILNKKDYDEAFRHINQFSRIYFSMGPINPTYGQSDRENAFTKKTFRDILQSMMLDLNLSGAKYITEITKRTGATSIGIVGTPQDISYAHWFVLSYAKPNSRFVVTSGGTNAYDSRGNKMRGSYHFPKGNRTGTRILGDPEAAIIHVALNLYARKMDGYVEVQEERMSKPRAMIRTKKDRKGEIPIDWIGNMRFVLQWHEVQHYVTPDGKDATGAIIACSMQSTGEAVDKALKKALGPLFKVLAGKKKIPNDSCKIAKSAKLASYNMKSMLKADQRAERHRIGGPHWKETTMIVKNKLFRLQPKIVYLSSSDMWKDGRKLVDGGADWAHGKMAFMENYGIAQTPGALAAIKTTPEKMMQSLKELPLRKKDIISDKKIMKPIKRIPIIKKPIKIAMKSRIASIDTRELKAAVEETKAGVKETAVMSGIPFKYILAGGGALVLIFALMAGRK